MKIYTEMSLQNFKVWSGAVYTKNSLTQAELTLLDSVLADMYPQGIDEHELNDLLWNYRDDVADWVGFDNWEELELAHLAGYEAKEFQQIKKEYMLIDFDNPCEFTEFKEEYGLSDEVTDKMYVMW